MVRRLLPQRGRRMVGAWCFMDTFGPDDVENRPGMQVGPHPHTGLQTVTWLAAGEVLHRDSLGSLQYIQPGQLNLMTAGRGISHSEESPAAHPPLMHGIQLWVALPDSARETEPSFDHHPELPVYREGDVEATVVMGTFAGVTSPARTFSPLAGVEIVAPAGSRASLPLDPGWEYAVVALSGAAGVAGERVEAGPLLYLGDGRSTLDVVAAEDTRLFLVGGEPFDEPLVMWWNFVARSHEEIVEARDGWMSGDERFGEVKGYNGPALPAPLMPTVHLKARGRVS
nr:pirin family protein [Longispora albida]